MTTNASRAPVDFDAFERELHQPSQQQASSPSSAKTDPLAELARIVGQDDPFRALLEARGTARPAQGARIEPSFEETATAAYENAPQPAPSPADAFDQYLASVEQSHPGGEYQDPAAFESDDGDYRNAATQHPRNRSRLAQVGAGLGVLALCVTGALAWKGLPSDGANGGPVTVLADKTPLKVAPEKADGVDIPDQNKQIYDRTAKEGQIKVVNREEQPLDVAQAARAASREANVGGVTPGGGMLTESLGEPRRIRTVAVKPDTPPPAMQQREASADPESHSAPLSPIPTMVMPDGSNDGSATTAAASSRRSPRALASNPAPTTQVADAAPAEQPLATPPAAARKTPKRVASVGPETAASMIEPETAAPASAPTSTASVGGYAVQLGVRNSEADAHAAFLQMQGKYNQLSGKPALIRQAEVNGKSLYRVRVGPLGKSEANSLCTQLKGAGGQCFVAAN